MKQKNKGKIVIYILTVIVLLILLFPFFVALSTALKPLKEVYTSPPHWIPHKLWWRNFTDVWTKYPLAHYFVNSFIIASGATVFNIILCIPAAYAVSRLKFYGRRTLLFSFLVVQMFSPIIVVISLFKIFAKLGLVDTLSSLIIVNTVFTLAFSIWMLNGYFSTIPIEIEEAALIDGCTRLKTITRIILPIALPGVVTTLIYTFITAWNEFMFALTLINTAAKRPLTLGLYDLVGRWEVQWQYLTAASLFAIAPVIILFILIEKQLVKGLAGGAIKG
ncbi:carbohydrate ABC transporter permease [Candidatus Aerophobetes bacterium]|nr:carbohydrate ABC transporter permease [Candidatus Aerophobetes bacterium]